MRLQRRVYEFYDVAAAATECNQTQAHCAREAVIKCNAWRHQCVGRVLTTSCAYCTTLFVRSHVQAISLLVTNYL